MYFYILILQNVMKTIKFVLICDLIVLLFISCGNNDKDVDKSADYRPYNNDIFEYGDDTTFMLTINNKIYQLILTHDKQKSIEYNWITVINAQIVDNSNHDTLYKSTFKYNQIGDLTKSGSNNYYLTLNNSGGGSGFKGTLFKIKIIPYVSFQPIIDINELSDWKFNKYDTEMLFFKGYWGDNEIHFQEHKQYVSICKIQENNVIIKKLGMTKHKHIFCDGTETLKDFKKKEPVFLKKIKWEDYE